MREEEILDKLIEIVDLIAKQPTNPPNPMYGYMQIEMAKLKLARAASKKRFSDHFSNLTKIVKQVSEIKM